VGSAMKKKERIEDRISEREYHDRLKSLLKNDFNTQLEPLKSLKTATKKRRAERKPRVGSQRWETFSRCPKCPTVRCHVPDCEKRAA